MSPEEIRAAAIRERYVEVLARAEYEQDRELVVVMADAPPWENATEEQREEYRGDIVSHLLDALTADGLLPLYADTRWVYEPDGTPLGHREIQFLTEWQTAPAPCRGCGVSERECAKWVNDSVCCADCRHPLWEVAE